MEQEDDLRRMQKLTQGLKKQTQMLEEANAKLDDS
jgi:hypothetical protein